MPFASMVTSKTWEKEWYPATSMSVTETRKGQTPATAPYKDTKVSYDGEDDERLM